MFDPIPKTLFFHFCLSGISEDEKRKRRESNILSTKISFFSWLFEVKEHQLFAVLNISKMKIILFLS